MSRPRSEGDAQTLKSAHADTSQKMNQPDGQIDDGRQKHFAGISGIAEIP
ncbi:hypothetical protein [Leminorella grimontii]